MTSRSTNNISIDIDENAETAGETRKRLILVGGGHSHLQVIKGLNYASRPKDLEGLSIPGFPFHLLHVASLGGQWSSTIGQVLDLAAVSVWVPSNIASTTSMGSPGLVGIFLGYSLMQVPDLILNTVRYFKQNVLAEALQ